MWYSTQQSVAVGSWRGQRITGGPRLAVAMDTVSSESAGTVGSGVAQSQSLSVDAAASSGQSSDADAYDTLYALDSFVGPSTLSVGARSSPGADALYADDSFEEFDVPESRSRTSSLCVEPADSDARSRASSLSEQGPWTGAVPVDLSQPEPQWQPEPEPEPAPEPAAPRSPPRDSEFAARDAPCARKSKSC